MNVVTLTIFKCKIQWHSVHSKFCVTITKECIYSKADMYSTCLFQIAFTGRDNNLHEENEEDMLSLRCLCDIYK